MPTSSSTKHEDESIKALRADVKARSKIVETLAALPDDDARRRVIGAVAVLMGYAVPIWTGARR